MSVVRRAFGPILIAGLVGWSSHALTRSSARAQETKPDTKPDTKPEGGRSHGGKSGGRGFGSRGKDVLRRMTRAETTQAYIAREIVVGGEGRTIEQWVRHDPKRGIRRESIAPAGELLIDNFKRCWIVSARGNRFIERESMLPKMRQRFEEALQRIGSTLKVEWQGQDRVADRTADIILIRTADAPDAPSRRFWVDRETGLRLRAEERAPDGRILSNSYFLTVDLNPAFRDDDFSAPPVPAGARRILDTKRSYANLEEAQKAGIAPKIPGFLPPGYALRGIDASEDKKFVTMRWGNELNMVSLTEFRDGLPPFLREKAGESGKFVDMPRNRRGYVWKNGKSGFVVMGALPDEQLKRIADSVR